MVLEGRNGTRVDAFAGTLDSGGPVLVTSSRVTDFTDLAVAMLEQRPAGQVSVLTDGSTFAEVRRRFPTAAHLADFVEADLLRIRTGEQHLPTYLLTGSELAAVTGIDDSLLTTFAESGSAFVEDTHEEVQRRFEAAEDVSLRAPGYSRMLEALGEELDEAVREDLATMFERALEVRDDESDIDAVRLSILAGARNEVQMYDLSRWGEESGVASRSKYSREKTRLEDLGVVDTEKVDSGVGRPRQRLVLGDDVADADAGELVSRTGSVVT